MIKPGNDMRQLSLRTPLAILAAWLSMPVAVSYPTQAGTLDTVRERGALVCGVSEGLRGFSAPDANGEWSGFDVDLCRAVAAAVLGERSKVTFVPLSAEDRFRALADTKIDLLSRNSTWTMSRDLELGLTFPAITYYDGQGFMLPEALGISSVGHLSGAKVCVVSGTTTQDNIVAHFAGAGMVQSLTPFPNHNEALKHYENGECDTFSADRSALFADRLLLATPAEHMILPEVITKEPLGPVVRDGDEQWADIVRWTVAALINAEELQLTRATLANKSPSLSAEQQSFLATAGKLGRRLGLTEAWVTNVVAAVGNYGQIFERNLGGDSDLGIVRGLNALWSQGGLIYAPPMR